MKKLYLTIVLLLAVFFSQAQIVNIPDPIFKDALVNHPVADIGNNIWEDVDTNDDGEIQVSEAEVVQKLFMSTFYLIYSIEGIQSFINLIELVCAYSNLVSVDISQNLNLEVLNFRNNQLADLDITLNENIEYLDFTNNFISDINITQNGKLKTLICDHNQLNELDISQNHSLEFLQCSYNFFSYLNFNQNPNLVLLICVHNSLLNIDISQNLLLDTFYCSDNLLENIDISQNQNIVDFICRNNQLTSLNIQNGFNENFEFLYLSDNINLNCIQVDDIEYANQSNWIKDEWAEYSEDCTLGIEDDEFSSQFTIYPNPVQEILIIEKSGNSEITSIKFYDVLGRLVLVEKGNVNQLDVSTLNNGLLYVKIETEQGIITKKIIKE